MSEKFDEIPYKIYRAKVQATTKDANNSNKNIQPSTNWNAQTGFTTNRGSLTVVSLTKEVQHKSFPAPTTPSTTFNRMQQKILVDKEDKSEINQTAKTRDEFKRRKMERELEIKQIQNALNDLTVSQQKSTIEAKTIDEPTILTASTNENRTFARCKSDITHKSQGTNTARESARATNRTLNRNRSQSSEDSKRIPNRKSNVTAMQDRTRKKRSQSVVTMNAQKTALEKETIKKRLEDLRQNTRKIINKNLQKINKYKAKELPKEKAIVETKEDTIVLGNISFKRPTPRAKKLKEVEAKNDEELKAKENKPTTDKRIGLLRKPEYKDHSYSGLKDIDFNKENFVKNPNSPDRRSQKTKSTKIIQTTLSPAATVVIATNDVNEQVNDGSSLKSSARLESEATSAARMAHSGLNSAPKIQNLQQEIKNEQLKADLPYWLRPTSVQIYPYNFIKAVRRKLEAVTSANTGNLENLHVATSTSAIHQIDKLDQCTSMHDSKQKSSSLQSLSIHAALPVRSLSCSSSKQLQSLESNFSSISIQLPTSNTESEVSSLASDIHDTGAHSKIEPSAKESSAIQDDDTTVSSSILSHGEVEMKNTSPLSFDKFNKFHIKSKCANCHKHKIEKEHILPLQSKTLLAADDKPLDFDKCLLDINRSLSHVMQGYTQLKNTLHKSHGIYDLKKDDNISVKQKAQDVLVSTDYENDLFSKFSSTSAVKKNSKESIVENILKSSSSSSKSHSINVLSPATINYSYERSLRSNSSNSSSEQHVEKSESEAKTEKKKQLRQSLIETNVNLQRGDFQKASSFDTEEILTEQPENPASLLNKNGEHKDDKAVSSSVPQTISEKDSIDLILNSSEDSNNFYNESVYDKLLQKGVSKEDCLRACLKIREKFILDRTKSQVAMLEIQKERFKSQGLLEQIVAIKKKQRGILLKMEKERSEIQRLLQTKSSNSSISTHSTSQTKRRESAREVNFLADKQPIESTNRALISFNPELLPERVHSSSKLENSTALEKLLQRREANLQRRRDYVERLLQRHRLLDQEEIELQHLEQKLLKYNHETLHEKQQQQQQQDIVNKFGIEENGDKIHKSPVNLKNKSNSRSCRKHCLTHRTDKMERHLKEIDRSMRELRSISDVRSSSDNMNTNISTESSVLNMETNVVRTTGCKLNKLWRRLTSQQVEKYEPNKRYKLCKADVERLYEEAKFVVLNKFAQNKTLLASELLDKSITASIKLGDQNGEQGAEKVMAPELNLHAVNGADTLEEDLEESAAESAAQGNYHPSVAEENFNMRALTCTSTSSPSDVDPYDLRESPYGSTERKRIVEENVEKFLLLTNQLLVQHSNLERSSSETQLSEKSIARKSSSSLNSSKEKVSVEESVPELLGEEIPTEASHTLNTTPNIEILTDLQENNKSPNSTNNTVTESQITTGTEEITSTNYVQIETVETVENSSGDNKYILASKEEETTLTPEIISLVEHTDDPPAASSVEQSSVKEAEEISNSPTHNVLEEEVYSADFETSADETRIEDISAPIYEITFDTTREDVENVEKNNSVAEAESKEFTKVIAIGNKPSTIVPFPSTPSTSANAIQATTIVNSPSSTENATQLMPDIINELEIRRCQQIILENDQLKHYEHVTAMPYVFVREIPNKPPPPYVPPAHGSPMTTIFPSEERIKDITYRRTHELYCEMLKTDYVNEAGEKLPSVLDDKITNIYERIILDICCEYLTDNRDILEQGDPANFHSQLAFFNPPDRLRCLQESIHREVRRCLAMDKSSIKRSQVYSVYGQRAKRDHIDKIIIQELYDDDEKWCNFIHEEQEVLELMVEEMFNKYLRQVVSEVYLEECPVPVLDEESKTEMWPVEPPLEEPTTSAQD